MDEEGPKEPAKEAQEIEPSSRPPEDLNLRDVSQNPLAARPVS